MYRLMRNIHLILGLVFVFALWVYLLSSVRLAHRGWFAGGPTVTDESYPVDPDRARTPRELGLYLIEEHGLRGEIRQVRPPKEGAFGLTIGRLGTNHRIEYVEGASTAQVRTNQLAFTGMLMGMHFAHGFWHEDSLANIWSAVLLLTSVALFLLGATGIYLWFKTYEERRFGAVLLVAGLVFAFTSLYLVRSQG